MGCCVCNAMEIKSLELAIPTPVLVKNNSGFEDLSLSSDSEIPAKDLEEWQAFKVSIAPSLTDSVGMMSTLLQSERKVSAASKPGSLIDSFTVSFLRP